MTDDYYDRLAALLPEDVLARHLHINNAISQYREELWQLRKELTEIARTYGVPGIDDPGSGTNERICQTLKAAKVEINSIWASAPPEWSCPCCHRTKPECARLGAKGQMLGKLVAHHDHIDDFMDVVLSDLSKRVTMKADSSVIAERFVRRSGNLFTRFERIIICEDCNNADANGKARVGAELHFTFTPKEIASFIQVSANNPHDVDETTLAKVYASAKAHYDLRVASIKKLAQRALTGAAWYEPVAMENQDEQLDREAQAALRLFGLDHVECTSVRDIFFQSQKLDREHAATWRTKQTPAPCTPTENEIEFATRGLQRFDALPKDWVCQCCARPKRDIVRWSRNSMKFMFSAHPRNVSDATTQYGTRKVTLCGDCNHTFQECHKECRLLLGEQLMPDYPVSLDDIRAVIKPKAHSVHEVDAEAAETLVSRVLSKLQAD